MAFPLGSRACSWQRAHDLIGEGDLWSLPVHATQLYFVAGGLLTFAVTVVMLGAGVPRPAVALTGCGGLFATILLGELWLQIPSPANLVVSGVGTLAVVGLSLAARATGPVRTSLR